MTWDDGDGDTLDGNQSYRLRFQRTPPVDAFWSVTMYDLPEFYLVANPIDRYSIGDRTPGLVYAERRLADDRHAARPARRRSRSRELAADPSRTVPPNPADVRASR